MIDCAFNFVLDTISALFCCISCSSLSSMCLYWFSAVWRMALDGTIFMWSRTISWLSQRGSKRNYNKYLLLAIELFTYLMTYLVIIFLYLAISLILLGVIRVSFLHYFAFTVSKCCLICWYYNKLVQFTFLFGLFLSFVHWLPSDSQNSRLYWWKCGFIFSCFSLNWSAVDVVFLLFYDATNCIPVS